ncbi:MAG: energy transducer TonB [Terracidiphilus sp.]
MRSVLIASLLLAPLAFTVPAVASQPSVDAIPSTHNLQLSTGVTSPAITERDTHIEVPSSLFADGLPDLERVDLKLRLDREGRAENIRVVNSDDPYLNAPVVAAVRQFRWRPARLDHHTIPIGLNLRVRVHM